MTVRIVRLGSPRLPGEGVRLGTVRRPPRVVPKSRFAKDDWYDVWVPLLSPSADLVKRALGDGPWPTFVRQYRAQMKKPEAAQLLEVLAALSQQTSFSVGCYCEDESRCHRSVLRELLRERRAKLG